MPENPANLQVQESERVVIERFGVRWVREADAALLQVERDRYRAALESLAADHLPEEIAAQVQEALDG